MRPVHALLAEYAADHQNPVNRTLHAICVPIIVVSVLGLLRAVPVPPALAGASAFVNCATVPAALALLWYLRLSAPLGAGMAVALLLALAAVAALAQLPVPLWATSAAMFTLGWAGQFIGHGFEGRRPSFLRDLRFLLVGPLWVLDGLYRRIGMRVQPG